jgi:hypothetical protein
MGPRSLNKFIAAVLSVGYIICFAPSAGARVSSAHGRAAAGSELALRVCTGCHIVSPDQPFPPIITPTPSPPDFRSAEHDRGIIAPVLVDLAPGPVARHIGAHIDRPLITTPTGYALTSYFPTQNRDVVVNDIHARRVFDRHAECSFLHGGVNEAPQVNDAIDDSHIGQERPQLGLGF